MKDNGNLQTSRIESNQQITPAKGIPASIKKQIVEEINKVTDQYKAFKVTDDDSAARAGEILVSLKALVKMITAKKDEIVKPISDNLKATRDEFKIIETPVSEIETRLRKELATYTEKKQAAAEKEKAKLLAAAAKKAEKIETKAEGGTDLDRKLAEHKAEQIKNDAIAKAEEKAVKPLTVGDSTVSTMKVWKYEITDEEKLPREYLQPNPAAINRAVKGGAREIPGVRIYQESTTTLRKG